MNPLVAILPEFREPANTWTHLVGAVAAVVGTVFLWRHTAGDRGRRIAAVVFGVSMVLLYSASSLYHGIHACDEHICFCRKLDLAAIFLLIAGTYTPIYYSMFTGLQRAVIPAAVWGLAIFGITAEFVALSLPDIAGPTIYILMGWLGIGSYLSIAAAISHARALWAVVGGGFYTVGAVMDNFGWPVIVPGAWESHETFHVFVLAGSLTFYFWILWHVLPYRPGEPAAGELPRADKSPEMPVLPAAIRPSL